jgi:hypothetical protein
VGLYLCVFSSDEFDNELDGIDVGSYDDFHDLRQAVCDQLEDGHWAKRFPTLMNHPDSDGEWSPGEAVVLIEELLAIQREFRRLPPAPTSGWRAEAIKRNGVAKSLDDCFVDVDSEPLTDRLANLARLAVAKQRPILFQ